VLEWALSLETIPPFLRATYGATLEGLAYTASRLVELCRAAATPGVLVSLEMAQPVAAYRFLAAHLDTKSLAVPLHLKTPPLRGRADTLFQASIWLGTLLCDGLGDSLQIDSDLPAAEVISLSYNILQAARLRMSKTEFISCPSCGRTLFNLQTTTERIKSRMSHLKEVKIAIMGCIVNGPGEMADADFGYVGSGPGKISLYVGKECVERNLPEAQADERLIQLIQTHGKWVDPV
jgi:(E)-4-hydroxy-3-methylbut-2-enyl-diphosphate synthase